MINEAFINNMTAGINSVSCPICGKIHHVNLSLNASHSLAQSSIDMLLLPNGDKLFVEMSDDACEEFKTRLKSFVLANLGRIVESPFDKI